MTKRIIFILLAVFWGLGLQAQTVEKDGTYYYDAIPVTFDIGKMIFTDVRDTRKVPPWYNSFIYMPKGSSHYQKTQGNAVFYRMEIPASGNVIVHNWNSRMGFSSLFVYRLLSELQPDSDVNIEEVEIFEEGDFMSPDFDPEKPYEAMARRMVYHALNGSAIRRIEAGIRHAKETGADGVVWFGHWGCKHTLGAAQLAKRKFEEQGIPLLILDGDGSDRSHGGEGQTSTRLGAFLEMLNTETDENTDRQEESHDE